MSIIHMTDLDLAGKRVLIREDLNVPMDKGRVADDWRIRASLTTIEQALEAGARVMLMSHLGRPSEGRWDEKYTLAPVAERLSQVLRRDVRLVQGWLDGVDVAPGEVVLLENVRFNAGEKANDPDLARRMAALCDVYVMDAFAAAHRAQASTAGVADHAPVACAGPLLTRELDALGKALEDPARPMVAIVGGSKVSSKLTVLESLSRVVDRLIVGGGIANTFIAAAGYDVGRSLYEPDLVEEAARLMKTAQARGAEIPVPVDVVCAKEFSEHAQAELKGVDEIAPDDMVLDLGPRTLERFREVLGTAGTIVWNGPLGAFEMAPFSAGTRALARAVADSPAFSIAGGGDTLAAVTQFGVADRLSYVSTGGGAFLEFLEGKKLPAVMALEEAAVRYWREPAGKPSYLGATGRAEDSIRQDLRTD